MNLEIVAHCYLYTRLLTYQLSSLLRYPPSEIDVLITVFYAREDQPTFETLVWFMDRSISGMPKIRAWPLERRSLMRRAIGRNMAALNTKADYVWFAGCDYVFGPGCLDALVGQLPLAPEEKLFYPSRTRTSTTHADGDRAIERVTGPGLYEFPAAGDPVTFQEYDRAIGCLQIVRGDVARELGYCRDTRWQEPADEWQRTHEDPVYRHILGTDGRPISLPNLYRIRHSICGRETVGAKL